MTWIITGTCRDRNIFSKTFGQSIPCVEAYDDPEDLVIHLLKSGAMEEVLCSMLGRVLTPDVFLDFLKDSPSMTCGEALDSVIEDVASALFREGLGIIEGQDVTLKGIVLAKWVEEVEE